MQFLVNSIEKVKLQYIHLYNFLLNLYFNELYFNNKAVDEIENMTEQEHNSGINLMEKLDEYEF